MLSCYLLLNEVTQWWLSPWPTDKSTTIFIYLQYSELGVGGNFPSQEKCRTKLLLMQTEHFQLLQLHIKIMWQNTCCFYSEEVTGYAVCQWTLSANLLAKLCPKNSQKIWSFSKFLVSISVWNIAGNNGTTRSSHTELLDEELQATGCTPPTSQQRNQLVSLPCCSQTYACEA